MLNTCFGHAPNDRTHDPKKTEVTEPIGGNRFGERAFTALSALAGERSWSWFCRGARAGTRRRLGRAFAAMN